MKKLLLVEDDLTLSKMLSTWLSKQGYDVATASSVRQARKSLDDVQPDVVLSDLRLPDADGTELLDWMRQNGLTCPLIIMTGYADIDSAVTAMKMGAKDYIAKPLQPDILLRKIEEAIENSRPATTPAPAKRSTAPKQEYLEGKSEPARQLYNYVALVAPTPMSVLIHGDSGTGKEYVAHRIHELSKRSDGPFVALDCGAIPRDLAASEFFGHVKGSFTGAYSDKTGAFVEANGGTLFLDEIGNLSYDVQVQLLRALQERRIRPLGSDKEIEVDIRLVSATNENLQQAVQDGRFREDLYHRVNEFSLHIPTLAERQEDIPLFAEFFLDQANRELGRDIVGFAPDVIRAFCDYAWPGNLRQMRNVVKRAALLSNGQFIMPRDIGEELRTPAPLPQPARPLLHEFKSAPLFDEEEEKRCIAQTLLQTRGNKSRAAKLLGIDRKTLYNKLKLYGMGQYAENSTDEQ